MLNELRQCALGSARREILEQVRDCCVAALGLLASCARGAGGAAGPGQTGGVFNAEEYRAMVGNFRDVLVPQLASNLSAIYGKCGAELSTDLQPAFAQAGCAGG